MVATINVDNEEKRRATWYFGKKGGANHIFKNHEAVHHLCLVPSSARPGQRFLHLFYRPQGENNWEYTELRDKETLNALELPKNVYQKACQTISESEKNNMDVKKDLLYISEPASLNETYGLFEVPEGWRHDNERLQLFVKSGNSWEYFDSYQNLRAVMNDPRIPEAVRADWHRYRRAA